MSAPARPKPDRSKPSSQGFAIPGAAPVSGIKVLHDDEQTNIDILFIHGLSGHREKTWTAPGETDPWPKTLLPAKVPNARILTYGYDANWKKGPASTNRTKEHASNFMNRLTQFRDEDQSENRPLIFVCHSLGGLVCMDTLVHSKEQADPRLRSIYERTIGVAFLGTPHQGSDLASPAQKLSSLMKPFNQTNGEIVQVLKQDSEILSRIQDSFQLMLQGRSRDGLDPISITYFFEELAKSRFLGIIVPKHSATRPGCPQIGIRSNHSNMTKFADMNDDGFQKVSGEIHRWASNIKFMPGHASIFIPGLSAEIDKAVSKGAKAHFVVPYPTNPEFVGRENILQELKDRLDYSDVHRTWHPRVALYGLGGVGKTHIVIAFVYWFKVKHPDVSIYWVHASNTERFRESFMSAAQECHITGLEDPKNDILLLFRDWLKNKDHGRWLVVVDNADDSELFTSHHKRSFENLSQATRNLGNFLPECAHGGVLITTRNIQAGSRLVKGNELLEIQKMDSPECERLLLSQIPKDIATSADIMVLSGELEFLPLAIVQAAAFIRENRISVAEYLDVFRQNKVKLLQEEFETIGRDPDTPRALSATWILSHKQIQRQNPLAGEFLSLMSLFDRQDVPLAFFTNYYERKTNKEGEAIEITKALGILKGFCLIAQQRNGNFDMHRLVQLVARDWLGRQGTRSTFHEEALLTVLETFPDGSDIKWRDTCSVYLSHAQAVFERFPGTAKSAISASLAFSISKYYYLLGKWQDVEYWAREARGIQLHLFGKEDLKTLEYANQLARAYSRQGRLQEAERLEVQVLELSKRILGEEHPNTITSMGNLASIYRDQGRFQEAEQLKVQVLEISNRILGEEHPYTITLIGNLASIYRDQGRFQEAEQLKVQVLELRKRILGKEHPKTITSMGNLASIYRDQGRSQEAEQLKVQVLELRKRILGEEHPDTITSMGHLACTYRGQGRFQEAEQLEVQVLEISKRILGEEHPDTIILIGNLASTYRGQGRFQEAEQLEVQVLELRERILGKEHPNTINSMGNLASTYKAQGRFQEAEQLEVQVLEISKRILGEEHPDTISLMGNLACTYGDQGRLQEAEQLEVQVQELSKRALGEEHPNTITSIGNLANTYRGQGRLQEAEQLEVQVLELRKRTLSEEHPNTITSMGNLAYTYRGQGRFQEAEQLEVQVLEISKRILGEEHPDTINSMGHLACTYRDQGRLHEAEQLEVQVLEISKRILGEEHPDTINSMGHLACTYRDQGRLHEAEQLEVQVLEISKRILG